MTLLVSTFENQIDTKGRVSVPSEFRSSLITTDNECIMLYPSIRNNCIEGCSIKRFEEIAAMISDMNVYSDERDALEFAIFAESFKVYLDPQGRMNLPKKLVSKYNFIDKVVFVGKGKFFEIWHEDALEEKISSLNNIKLKHHFLKGA